MASKPYLTLIDKKWIVFQLLYAYYQLVEVCKYHGDINFDNILLSSNMTVYLTDIANHKPHKFSSDDFSTLNNWYCNEYNENKPIYFAPEKIIDNKNCKIEMIDHINEHIKMDIFSLGVVIGQLFLEDTFFTRKELLYYKLHGKDNKDMEFENKLKRIEKNYNGGKLYKCHLVMLLRKMLKVDPNERISIEECLKDYCDKICPMPIPRFVIYMNYFIIRKCQQGDHTIGIMNKYWKQIYSLCYLSVTQWNKHDNAIPQIKGNLYYKIFHFIKKETSLLNNNTSHNDNDNVIAFKPNIHMEGRIPEFPFILNDNEELEQPLQINVDNYNEEYQKLPLENDCMKIAHETGYIFLNFIFHALQNIKYDSTILIALEMIYHFSKNLSSITKIEFVIPHIISLFAKENTIIKISSLNCLFQILKTIKFHELKLKLIDSSYFRSYIFPKLIEHFQSNVLLRKILFSHLDIIALYHMKFLHSVIKHQIYHQTKQSNNINTDFMNINQSIILQNVKQAKGETANRKLKEHEIMKLYHNEMNGFYEQLKDAFWTYILDNKTGKYDSEVMIEFIKKLPKVAMILTPTIQFELQQEIFGIVYKCYGKNDSFINVVTEIIKIIPQLAFIEYNSFAETFLDIGLKYGNEMCIVEAIHSAREFVFRLSKLDINNYLPIITNIIPLVKHPNYQIRQETKMFFKEMVLRYKEDELKSIKQQLSSKMNKLFPQLQHTQYEFNNMFIDNMCNAKIYCPKCYYDLYMYKEDFPNIINENDYLIIPQKEHTVEMLTHDGNGNDDEYKIPLGNKEDTLRVLSLKCNQIILSLPYEFRQKDFMFLRKYLFHRYIKGIFHEGRYYNENDYNFSNEIESELVLNEKINIEKVNEIYYKHNNNESTKNEIITNEKINFLNNYFFDKNIVNNIITLSKVKYLSNEEVEGYLISFCSIQEGQIVNLINEQFNLKSYPSYVDIDDETNQLPYCFIKFVISIISKESSIRKQEINNKIYVMKVKLTPFHKIKDLIYEQLLKYTKHLNELKSSNKQCNDNDNNNNAISYFEKLCNILNTETKDLSLGTFLFTENDNGLSLIKLKYFLYALNIKSGNQLFIDNNINTSQSLLMSTYVSTFNKTFVNSLISSKYKVTNFDSYLDRYNSKSFSFKEETWEKVKVVYELNINNNSESIVCLLKIPSYTMSNTIFNKANNYNLFISVSQKGKVNIHYISDNLYSTSLKTDKTVKEMSLNTVHYKVNNLQKNNITLISSHESKHNCNDLVLAGNETNIHLLDLANQIVHLSKHNKLITCISPTINSEYDLLLLANHDCSLSLFDLNNKSIVQTCNYYNHNNGFITSILHLNDTNVLLSTSLGCVLEYDYRLNMIVNKYSFINKDRNTIRKSIEGLISFKPPQYFYNMNEYDFVSNHNYCFIYCNEPSFDMCLWDVTANKNKFMFTNRSDSQFYLNVKEDKCLFNRKFSYYDNVTNIINVIEKNKVDVVLSNVEIPNDKKNFLISFEILEEVKEKVNCACIPFMNIGNCNKACVITGGENEINSWNFEKQPCNLIKGKMIMKNMFAVNDIIMLDNLCDNKKFLVSAHENGSVIVYANND